MRFAPPIVAVCDPLRLASAARGRPIALPVGLVPWEPELERTTVVVKTTYRFDPRAEKPVLELCREQPGFGVAQASTRPGAMALEVDVPTDLVRAKPAADVLLVGHAHTDRARERIDAELHLPARLRLAFSTVGPTPIERMPLGGDYLRDRDGQPVPPVGPMRARPVAPEEAPQDGYGLTLEEREQQYRDAIAAIAAGEWKPWEDVGLGVAPEEPAAARPTVSRQAMPGEHVWGDLCPTVALLDEGVQFAAAQLCCSFPAPGEIFELVGLLPGGGKRRLRLPDHEVVVVAEGAIHYDVAMVIDTVLIDTDAGTLALGWRGQVPEDLFAHSRARLVVALAPAKDVPPLSDIERDLPRAVFTRAAVPDGADVGAVPEHDVELLTARQRTFDRTPEPILPMDEFAQLAAALARQPDKRDEVLRARGLERWEWMLEERAWLERVGAALAAGDLDAVNAYNGMLRSARKAHGEPAA